MHHYICKECGKEFKSIYKNRKFCSVKCANKNSLPIRTTSEIVICKGCGKKFKRQKHRLKKGYYFCNQQCKSTYYKSIRPIIKCKY